MIVTQMRVGHFVIYLPELPVANVEDLSISKTGKNRMLSYIRQYALVPLTEIQQKRKRQKLKTFTKTRDTSKKLSSTRQHYCYPVHTKVC